MAESAASTAQLAAGAVSSSAAIQPNTLSGTSDQPKFKKPKTSVDSQVGDGISHVHTEPSVLVVGSINVDLYQKLSSAAEVTISSKRVEMSSVKGMTLPASSFVAQPAVAKQLKAHGLGCEAGAAEALVLMLEGPFEQKTGGKGANAAAAAGQTFRCELVCNFGRESEASNKALLADLKEFGSVDTSRSQVVDGPTGTAYILLFEDFDNAILLLGGANQAWAPEPLHAGLQAAISECVAVMLQREVPEHVNCEVAKAARKCGKPVIMDVGGTDAPVDAELLPHITMVAPNETELTFISGVATSAAGRPSLSLVRQAVSSLKAKFSAAGNSDVEVLVTLGGMGAVHFAPAWAGASDTAHETRVGTFRLATPDGRPKDTTGAGDCFRGSFIAALYGRGKSVAAALTWAAAAASLSVEVEGAMPSMPTQKAIGARLLATPMKPFDEAA